MKKTNPGTQNYTEWVKLEGTRVGDLAQSACSGRVILHNLHNTLDFVRSIKQGSTGSHESCVFSSRVLLSFFTACKKVPTPLGLKRFQIQSGDWTSWSLLSSQAHPCQHVQAELLWNLPLLKTSCTTGECSVITRAQQSCKSIKKSQETIHMFSVKYNGTAWIRHYWSCWELAGPAVAQESKQWTAGRPLEAITVNGRALQPTCAGQRSLLVHWHDFWES